MKKGLMVGLGVLLLLNILCLYKIRQETKKIPVVLQEYRLELDKNLSSLNVLVENIQIIKGALGWKTTTLSPEACISPEAYLDGPFSFVTYDKDSSLKCDLHEFTKLNDFLKGSGSYYLDGRFGNFLRPVTGDLPSLQSLEKNVKKMLGK